MQSLASKPSLNCPTPEAVVIGYAMSSDKTVEVCIGYLITLLHYLLKYSLFRKICLQPTLLKALKLGLYSSGNTIPNFSNCTLKSNYNLNLVEAKTVLTHLVGFVNLTHIKHVFEQYSL